MLEASVEPILQEFAKEHQLYLDKKGPRYTRGNKVKVTWTDSFDNKHDLDFVLEREGSPTKTGKPVAFIELAWRSYTKHSRNKSQEIQGAIEPLAATYEHLHPFKGVILAGVFTEGALNQLRSRGFKILFFTQDTAIKAFKTVDIDAYFGEATSEAEIAQKIFAWGQLTNEQKAAVGKAWINANINEIGLFLEELKQSITRTIQSIRVLPLYGKTFSLNTLEHAIEFVKNYTEVDQEPLFVRYEIQIAFTDGSLIEGKFLNREKAVEFLRIHQQTLQKPIEHINQPRLDAF